MKFAKHLHEKLEGFQTPEYRECSIPYKSWKKAYKAAAYKTDGVAGAADLDRMLLENCMLIDAVFRKHWKAALSKRNASKRNASFCRSFKIAAEDVNPCELIEFAELNTTALYKICKKWHKHGVASFELYHKMRTQQRFAFMGSGELTLLKLGLEQAEEHEECPICLDGPDGTDDNPQKIVVMACGHWVCWDCMDTMTRIHNIKGTLHNRLLNASRRANCPVCRERDPLRLGALCVKERMGSVAAPGSAAPGSVAPPGSAVAPE